MISFKWWETNQNKAQQENDRPVIMLKEILDILMYCRLFLYVTTFAEMLEDEVHNIHEESDAPEEGENTC